MPHQIDRTIHKQSLSQQAIACLSQEWAGGTNLRYQPSCQSSVLVIILKLYWLLLFVFTIYVLSLIVTLIYVIGIKTKLNLLFTQLGKSMDCYGCVPEFESQGRQSDNCDEQSLDFFWVSSASRISFHQQVFNF